MCVDLSLGFLFCSIDLYFCLCASTILSWELWLCSRAWSQVGWFLQFHSSFSRSLWLFEVFCISIQIFFFFFLCYFFLSSLPLKYCNFSPFGDAWIRRRGKKLSETFFLAERKSFLYTFESQEGVCVYFLSFVGHFCELFRFSSQELQL